MITAMWPDPARPIEILFCCNTAFYQHLAVALVSLLENNAHCQIRIHLISSDTDVHSSQKLRASLQRYNNYEIIFYTFDLSEYKDFFVSNHVSLDTYLRIFGVKLLDPSLEKVLYLDSDIVVLGDIGELWSTDLKGNAVGAVPDPFVRTRPSELGIPTDRSYVNAGVLLINLDFWRQQNVCERLIAFIRRRGSDLLFWDQDAINVVLFEAILQLPYRWNYQARLCKRYWSKHRKELEQIRRTNLDISILHFSSEDKPWIFGACVPKRRIYYRYLRKTEWSDYSSFGGNWAQVPGYVTRFCLYCVGVDHRSVLRWMDRVRRSLRGSGGSTFARSGEKRIEANELPRP